MKVKLLIFPLLISLSSFAQKTGFFTDPDKEFKTGIDLYNKQQYGSAQQVFDKIVDYYNPLFNDVSSDAEYYAALCAIELFHSDAEYRIGQFIFRHPESPRVKVAFFQMGKFQYRKKEYQNSITWFEKVNKYDLSKEDLSEYYFKMGYCFYMLGSLEKANKIFFELINIQNKYQSPALYYYSHIEYANKNYETALNGFLRLKDDETFSVVVPYYLAQIYYQQKKYDKVIQFVPALLDSISGKRAPEITRILGESYYRTEKYPEALKYLLSYKSKASHYTREDMFELGFVYYKVDSCNKAVENFQLVTNADDILCQNALYIMADCYLKSGDKKSALHSFSKASKLDFDQKVKEISLFNYAKLSFELSYSPFNETLNAFNQYLELFPDSPRQEEIYNILVQVYMTSKNYDDALKSIERIKSPNNSIKEAYQRVSYFRALELFNNLEFQTAIKYFNKSLSVSAFNKTTHANALYWKAEAYFRLEKYDTAIPNYKEFLLTPGSFVLPEYVNSYYNLGYSYFKQKQYEEAISWFRKYTDSPDPKPDKKLCDAFIRTGDSYFITRNYENAVDFYNRAVKTKAYDIDYALYQSGISYGILKNYNGKIDALNHLVALQTSSYTDDALFELARTYVLIDSLNLAIKAFDRILTEYPNSSYVVKTLPQLGLIYFNKEDYQKALELYKKTVSDYPGTYQAKDALTGIKNTYIELKDVDSYFAYAKNLGTFANISAAQQDSLTYLAAEKAYMAGDCEKATELFSKYLQSYGDGTFILNARYYSAECMARLEQYEKALETLQLIISRPKNMYTESALKQAAEICFRNKWFEQAYNYYKNLENSAEIKSNALDGRIGQMRSAYLLNWYEKAIEAANKVILSDKLAPEIIREVHLVLAESYRAQNKSDFALTEYKIIASDSKSEQGAKAQFCIFEILLEQKRINDAESEIMDFISANPPYPFLLAKSFILLSDIYLMKNENFNAKTALQSIIDNYPVKDDGILDEAARKLETIVSKENEQFKDQQNKEMEIKFDQNSEKDNQLFKNEQK